MRMCLPSLMTAMRRSSVVAVVMVLQRLEGLSDREAVDRFAFDARWRCAAGVGGYDGDGWVGEVRAHGAGRHAGSARGLD